VGTKNTKQLTSIEQLSSENNKKTSNHDKLFCAKKLRLVKNIYTANRTSMNEKSVFNCTYMHKRLLYLKKI
jgi:hypothetical protein